MASRTKRNMATIGGNIAAKRSDSYLIPALAAAGAVLELLSADGSTERIGIAEYTDEDRTYDDMLITSVTVPEDIRMVSKRYANTAQSHAVLTLSAALGEEGICLNGAVKNVGLLHFCDLEKAFRDDPDISEEEIIEKCRELAAEYPYVYVDGIYLKKNWGGVIEGIAILTAIGVNSDGNREVIGAMEGGNEERDG